MLVNQILCRPNFRVCLQMVWNFFRLQKFTFFAWILVNFWSREKNFQTQNYQNLLNKIGFWSCWNVFQVILNHIHRYKKALGIWSLGPKMCFLNKNWKILDLWVKSRNFYLKIIFFWKVQVIGYIFHIYHTSMYSKWILTELRAFEATCKIIVFFCQNHL